MSSCLEIRPENFTIVVGPTFVAQVIKELLGDDCGDDVSLPTLDFKSIVDRGVSYLLKRETFTSDSDKEKFVARYNNAYELDPVFVLRKIVGSLQSKDCYEEWLTELFACTFPAQRASKSLQRLLSLQSQGALVVYVHCDDIIARAARQEPVLLENREQMERWAKGEVAGIMQPHGVYSQPNTVKLDCLLYDSATHPLHAAVEGLRQVLSGRNTILLGEDWGKSKDPFLTHFCKRFVSSEPTDANKIVFTTAEESADLPALPLHASSPLPALYATTPASVDLWKQIKVELTPSSPPCQYQVVCLLVSSQAGARDISHMMFNAPGVNFALVNPITYGISPAYCVSVRVSLSSLPQLWSWLLTSSRDVLLSYGLMGIALQGGTILWLQDTDTMSCGGDDADCSSSSADYNMGKANSTATSPSTANPTSTPHDVLSTVPQMSTTSPSSQMSAGCGSEVRAHTKIQRYKVVKKRSQIVGIGGSHTDKGVYSGHFLSKTCEDAGNVSRKYLYARRGSLPPIKCGEPGNALTLLAERLQTPPDGNVSSGLPSYVAIKRALLSEKFKCLQNPMSGLVVPKMLLNLLQAKKDPEEKPNLLAYRRNSDPGSYLQHRDKTRRRQLFLDENMQWLKTHGPIIEEKIQSWKKKRLLRLQREYFYLQQEKLNAVHQQGEIHLVNPGKLIPRPFYSSLASSTVPSSLTSLPQTFVAAAGSGVNGFSPAPLMYQLPSAGLTPTPVLVPAPFVSPYTLMGSYTTLPVTAGTTAQPAATYIVPPTALAAGAQQRVVFLPSASTAGTGALMATSADHTTDIKPQISSLLAPTSSLSSEPEPSPSSSTRKRKNTFPEKLSSLLQPASDTDPASPPHEKRVCTASHTTHKDTRHLRCSVSPPPHSHTHISSHTSSHNSTHTTHDHRSHHDHHSHHHHRHRHYHHSHHSSSHHSTSSYTHYHHTSSSHSHHPHSHKSPSPLEQCLLQSPPSPGSDGRAADSPGESPSSFSSSAHTTDHSGHSPPQLWQFLLELLLTANCSHLIQWTDAAQECEFTIHEPVQVAELWGKCINNSTMNYDKLVKGLRYYYSKGIMEKVDGKKLTFRYNGLARSYVQRHFRKTVDMTGSVDEMVVVE